MVIAGILLMGCSTKSPTQTERENRMQNSPQFKDGKFVNPIEAPLMAEGSPWKYIKKNWFSNLFNHFIYEIFIFTGCLTIIGQVNLEVI